ncbi:MAG: helix-turn-helix domain-containing protein [Nitrosarchaeum sp.]|nr:helix-turn-helix domain-containing protein [Nitrosarchaeum sp.]
MNAQLSSQYLIELGFTSDESMIYLCLLERGPLSILHTANVTGIERTKLYRMIDNLKDRGLIEEQMAFKSKNFKAVSVERIEQMVNEKIKQTENLQNNFGTFKQEISQLQQNFSPTEVLYFRGSDGIKQMQWNTLRAKKKMVSYVSRAFQESVGQKFLEKYAEEWRKLGIIYHELKSEYFEKTIDPNKQLYPVDLGKNYSWKVVPKSVVNIAHNMDIYDDVVAMYYWKDEELFGIEIHNKFIADMQRSIFEMIWKDLDIMVK